MALQGNQADEGEHLVSGGAPVEDDEQRDHLVGMMASLGLGIGEQESAAAVVPLVGEEVDSACESLFRKESAATVAQFWGEHAAPVDHFVPSVPGDRVMDPYVYASVTPLLHRGTGAGAPPHDLRPHEEGHLHCVVAPLNGQHIITLPEQPGGVLHGGHSYMASAPFMHGGMPVVNTPVQGPSQATPVHPFLGSTSAPVNLELPPSEQEQEVLFALSKKDPKDIVSYACTLVESTHGQRLFRLVFMHCNLELREWVIARITGDKKSFRRICAQRPYEVVHMIEYCRTWRSMLLLKEAMLSWMAPNMIHSLVPDSNRVRVVLSFIKHSPRDIVQFIFEAVSRNCTKLACQPNGLSLLQDCLLFHGSQKERDDIYTKISYKSLHLSKHSCGNYIVQDVLKKGGPSHFAIIASCLRTNYVELSSQKYSSNVVEQCLRVFNEGERFVIVNELITYHHFRDLVTDEFANFVLSTALRTCSVPLRHMLATAILSQNISYRNQHCLKLFGLLSKLGYNQQKF